MAVLDVPILVGPAGRVNALTLQGGCSGVKVRDMMSNERFELRPGAVVVGADERLGWIDAPLAIPGTGQISGFVLREGLLFDRGVKVPIEAIERTEGSRVQVRLSAAQVNDLADSQARRYAESMAPAEHRLGTRQRVVCRDGEAGSLALVLVDPTSHRATHLVIRRDDLLDRAVIVPIACVRELTAEPIVLDLTREQLEALPAYRPDEQITDAVLSLLWYRLNMQPADLRYVKVQTHDGIVHLSGMTGTEQTRLAIEQHVRGVRGVLGVRNDLKTFEALAAAALAYRQLVGAATHYPLGSEPRVPLHLDDHRPGRDGQDGTEEAAFEPTPDVAAPLSAAA